MARMRYEIILAPDVARELRAMSADVRARVKDALEMHLRHEPKRTSKSRIKRLRGAFRPQYRLRVDEIRVFYDVSERSVEVVSIVPKDKAEAWLKEKGVHHEGSGTGKDQG